jgi:uncharacterized repeat protein (TIGR03803 family)
MEAVLVDLRGYAFAAIASALLSAGPAEAHTFTTIYSVTGSSDGAASRAGLVDVNGTIYGTTYDGGASGHGTVFAIDPVTRAETVLYSFSGGKDGSGPAASLIAVAGTLYGTTSGGGRSGNGTVFSIDPDTGAQTVLYSFKGGTDASAPTSALTAVRGTLYGTTLHGGEFAAGTVFAINPATGVETVLYSFSGSNDGGDPAAALINVGGTLYGTTKSGGSYGNGTVFSIDPETGAEKALYSFAGGNDGAAPVAALIAVNGTLTGTTQSGGASNAGTVFAIDQTTGAEKLLYSFTGGNDGAAPDVALIYFGGTLYGTTQYGGTSSSGTVFSIDPASGAENVLYSFSPGLQPFSIGSDNGFSPSTLIKAGSKLYGTTASGGTSGGGTVFSIDPATSKESVIHDFSGAAGASVNNLLNLDGTLFLTASSGGASSVGDVVAINPVADTAAEIHAFAGGRDGSNPYAPLISVGSLLYGTTYAGGKAGFGTVFTIDPATGAETVVHSFAGGGDGASPVAALLDAGNKLYGTTAFGGAAGEGTAFAIKPATGAEKVLYSFNFDVYDGTNPLASLIDVGGTLYGTAYNDGYDGGGTLFSVDRKTGAETVLAEFSENINSATGAFPGAALIKVGAALYGTTEADGSAGGGSVFSFDLNTRATTVLYNFIGGGKNGVMPEAALLKLGGKLYGTTAYGGSSNFGTVFSIDPQTRVVTFLHSFAGGAGGGRPAAALVNIGDTLYGTTNTGGTTGRGTVFSLVP